MNGIIDLYNVADFCEDILKGACGFLGMAAQGNLDAADLIDQFIHLRDEPGSTLHTLCNILEMRFNEFCANKQQRKWSLSSDAYLNSIARKFCFVLFFVFP